MCPAEPFGWLKVEQTNRTDTPDLCIILGCPIPSPFVKSCLGKTIMMMMMMEENKSDILLMDYFDWNVPLIDTHHHYFIATCGALSQIYYYQAVEERVPVPCQSPSRRGVSKRCLIMPKPHSNNITYSALSLSLLSLRCFQFHSRCWWFWEAWQSNAFTNFLWWIQTCIMYINPDWRSSGRM